MNFLKKLITVFSIIAILLVAILIGYFGVKYNVGLDSRYNNNQQIVSSDGELVNSDGEVLSDGEGCAR